MKRTGWAILAVLAVLVAAPPAGAAEIKISCSALGQELEDCRTGTSAWAARSGHTVTIVSTPNSATERLALYQQLLAARSPDLDVLQIDAIWPALLGAHLVDLKPGTDEGVLEQHLPLLIRNNTVEGELKALPWFVDAGLLYYRRDLLEKHGKAVPQSWSELAATAEAIQAAERGAGQGSLWGYVFQGKAYEGLTCNALEWVDAYGGGTIVDEKGEVTVANPQAAAALAFAAATVGKIAPEGVLNYAEEESRAVFQSGNAVFMRNWPYAWALAQSEGSAVKGKVGVAALPKGGEGGKATGALGGQQLAVSRYSRNQEAAADLVRYLTSAEEQKRRTLSGAYNPTITRLYEDPELLAAVPFLGSFKATVEQAVARPSTVTGDRYNQVSAEFFGAVHQVLSGGAEPEAALQDLERRLDRLSRGGRW